MRATTAREHQDVVLTDIGESLVRIKTQASEMGSELDAQHVILNDFSEEVGENQMQLERHERKLQNILNSSGCHKLTCLFMLVAIAIGLILVIVYA